MGNQWDVALSLISVGGSVESEPMCFLWAVAEVMFEFFYSCLCRIGDVLEPSALAFRF